MADHDTAPHDHETHPNAPEGELHAVTTGDIIDALMRFPRDTPAVIAQDPNNTDGVPCTLITGVDERLYCPTSVTNGEAYMTNQQRTATGHPDAYWKAPQGSIPAAVIRPAT